MFGRRSSPPTTPAPSQNVPVAAAANEAAVAAPAAPRKASGGARPGELDSRLQEIKQNVFNDLISTVDLAELAKLDHKSVREAIGEVVAEIINLRNLTISAAEQQLLVTDICNDVLGLGPLEPLIARDDIADIMVNGPEKVYIECNGKIELTDIKFRDQQQLKHISQRIVSAVGRRVDEASPICDARLADGSRVNVIAPPLALDGCALTIRKFKRDRLTLDKLVNFGSVSPAGAKLLQIVGHCRLNTIVSGGTGSGKTTLLNTLTQFIDKGERVITCEDAAELQLQQPHVLCCEARPSNIEGKGEVTIRDLVRNSLRMRPDRIVVGEVRGAEALDMLQAMNTGHDGSITTVHSNSPRDTLSRVETMSLMAGMDLPVRVIREQMASALDLVVHLTRLRDGTRRVTHVSEVMGMEGDVIVLQDLYLFDYGMGMDEDGKFLGQLKSTGIRPHCTERLANNGISLDSSLFASEGFSRRAGARR